MRNLNSGFMIPEACYFDEDEAREYCADPDFGAGWYSRLSAPGYMDCTDWQGPYENAFRAIMDVCRTYDVDVRGNDRSEVSA